MAGSQGVWELRFREKVIKIPEKSALKISRLQASEFTARLSEFDRNLYIVSILYCMNKNPCFQDFIGSHVATKCVKYFINFVKSMNENSSDNLYQVYNQDFVLFLDAV